MRLDGVAALVTGGGSGLGAATAMALAEAGARVTVLDRNEDAAHDVATRIGGLALVCDVTDAEGAARAVAAAADEHGVARVLVNCAGIGRAARIVGRDGPMKLDEFAHVVQVNLIGTFNMVRLAAAPMSLIAPLEDGERGAIINTASVAAYDGQIGQPAYGASKAGVVGLTLPAARELARFGIRVNTIAPGLFLTPLLSELPEAAQASLAASIPFPARLGLPTEFAALALHLLTNVFLNGETIRLDGALRMAPK
jgi:NAD(P)-dependent dehydrogenase (short-subunit alcohol dehydrogenase family)